MSEIRKYRAILKLAEQIPKIDCQRTCGKSVCGPVALTELEKKVIKDQFGLKSKDDFFQQTAQCPFYQPSIMGQTMEECRIYETRPLICRLWGVVDVDGMRCPYQCRVTPRMLTRDEAYQILQRGSELGGKAVTMAKNQYFDLEMGQTKVEEICLMICDFCSNRAVGFTFEGRSLKMKTCHDHRQKLRKIQ